MTDAEMSLILTVFWTHSISELKRAPVKSLFESCLRGWWWLSEKSCACNALMVTHASFKLKIKQEVCFILYNQRKFIIAPASQVYDSSCRYGYILTYRYSCKRFAVLLVYKVFWVNTCKSTIHTFPRCCNWWLWSVIYTAIKITKRLSVKRIAETRIACRTLSILVDTSQTWNNPEVVCLLL